MTTKANPSDSVREKIILVDDSIINLEIASSILSGDYIVYTAVSGDKLFRLLDKMIPALILLDIEMPIMDGYQVIKKLKSDNKTARIPVIFLTAADNHESEVKALKEGAVDYIVKPFSPEILKMRVDLHLLLQRQENALRESVRNAEIANNAKSSFIANMSHEMRTPLNAIIGFSELSLETTDLSKELYSYLVNIRNAGTTLLSTIGDILDISKIETGKFELIPVEYDTANLINDAVIQSIMHSGEKPISFNLTIDKGFPAKLTGDELRVKQILNNLLSNAFKYTAEGTVDLRLSCITQGDISWVNAKVEDTGVGIHPEDFLTIFDNYVQTDMTANRKIVGTGLGLSIAKRLANMMDGSINVESEYGKGSTFTVRIQQHFVSHEPISDSVIESLKSFTYSEQKRQIVEESLPQIQLPYAHILVVDDMDANLAVAKGLLRRYSIKTDCVLSGPEAITAIKDEQVRYSAIFMDHMMPDMDGIEATKLIRKIDSDYARNIPIIAFTANAIVGNEEMFLENGFQAFISKPIELTRLDTIIRDWVRDKSKEDEMDIQPVSQSVGQPVSQSVGQPVSGHALAIFDSEIDGVDLKKAQERYGDDSTYVDILRAFSKSIPAILKTIETVTEANLKEYAISIHGIRGSCYSICAEKAAVLAEALELAAKAGEYGFVSANNTTFIENVNIIISSANDIMAKIQGNEQKKQKDKPANQLLKSLIEACEQYDMSDIDTIVEELSRFNYDSGEDLVEWIREMSDEMNYDEIAERLRKP